MNTRDYKYGHKVVRHINESQLRNIVAKSVKKALNEALTNYSIDEELAFDILKYLDELVGHMTMDGWVPGTKYNAMDENPKNRVDITEALKIAIKLLNNKSSNDYDPYEDGWDGHTYGY